MKFVRIYIDAISFDLVTQDTAAKFVDRLSTFGGTLGLLTGFSIISAVEIIFFVYKFLESLLAREK